MKRFLFLIFLVGGGTFATAQVNVKDSLVNVPMIIPAGGVHVPLGDIQSRYKITYHIGGEFLYKHRSNWVWGFSGQFLFGENVDEPRIMNAILPLVSRDGTQPAVGLSMRGMCFTAKGGKIFPIGKKPNRNSGIMVNLGVGYIQHKINITYNGDLTPQISGDYVKGYDRLTDGVAISQFVGYVYLGNNRKVNFMAGLESIQGFTKNRRGYNYDTFQPDNGDKFDIFLGVKVGWIFTLYGKSNGRTNERRGKVKEFYYE